MAETWEEGWESFFADLRLFILDMEKKELESDSNVAESILITLSIYVEAIVNIRCTLEESHAGDRELLDFLDIISGLHEDLIKINTRWTSIEAGLGIKARRVKQCRGRPKVVIDGDKIEFLRELGFSWSKIAELFGVCRRTLYNVRCNFGMVGNNQTFTEISDRELHEHIIAIKSDMPDVGYNMMKGMLRSKGIYVPVLRIQQCLREIDPINTALRWTIPIYRRQYKVPFPNYIWHLDGNHKLVRWRLVVHGAVDGYSRLITFLDCNDNNRSSTVFALFNSGILKYGLPERIRTDMGGENVQVAEYMLIHSSVNNPVIVGSSVHNIRIERLWRDTFRCVLSLFYRLFYYLEDCEKLNPMSEVDLYCLHFVYIPRISKALEAFRNGWNNHAITTENSMTPVQLFTSGVLSHGPYQQSQIPHEENAVTVALGVDIPSTTSPLTSDQEDLLCSIVNPLEESTNYGIELYDQVKQFVIQAMNN